jgi:hypothetical protein
MMDEKRSASQNQKERRSNMKEIKMHGTVRRITIKQTFEHGISNNMQ